VGQEFGLRFRDAQLGSWPLWFGGIGHFSFLLGMGVPDAIPYYVGVNAGKAGMCLFSIT
jgi:hypothetical protein